VGIVVKDIEEAQRQYIEVLGLQPWDQGLIEMPGVKVVMFPVGDCYIELLQPTSGPEDPVSGDLARWLEKRGEGLCRLGLWVDNIDGEIKRLREKGAQVIDPGEYAKLGEEAGARMVFIHPRSTRGVLIELDQQM